MPKGSDLVFELHYTTSGKPASDISKLGLVLAKSAPEKRYFFHAGPTALNLAIPPGEGTAEVVSEITFGEDAQLVYAQPHMHLRGKDFELRVVTPDKAPQTVLKGNFNFEWQMGYQYAEPIAMPKGSKLQLITPLRQLHRQPLQPGSGEEGRVGTTELGRDEQLLHRRAVRHAAPRRRRCSSGRAEHAAARRGGPDACRIQSVAQRRRSGDQRQRQRERRRAGDQRRPGQLRAVSREIGAGLLTRRDSLANVGAGLQTRLSFYRDFSVHFSLSQWNSRRSVSGRRLNLTVADHGFVNVFGSSNVNSISM